MGRPQGSVTPAALQKPEAGISESSASNTSPYWANDETEGQGGVIPNRGPVREGSQAKDMLQFLLWRNALYQSIVLPVDDEKLSLFPHIKCGLFLFIRSCIPKCSNISNGSFPM